MAPNIKSMGIMSRHLSLLDLSSMTRSHSYQALSRAVSDIDLQQFAEPELIEQSAVCKDAFQANTISEDYWGWDEENDVDTAPLDVAPLTPLSKPSPAVDTASYWDWPVEETPVVADVLSLANIEANLIQAANAQPEQAVSVVSHDSYWAEAKSVSESKPQHEQLSYWDWHTTTEAQNKQASIAAIKQYEAARLLVSGAAIERSLRSARAPQRVIVKAPESSQAYWAWDSDAAVDPPHVVDSTHPDFDYWTWSDQPVSPADAILAYERARVLLSGERIQEKLQSQTISDSDVIRSNVDSSDYWNATESMDSYWDEQRTVPAVGGYWDM